MDARLQMSSTRRTFWAVSGALALMLTSAPVFANRYKLIDLGPRLVPWSINDRGDVLASKEVDDNDYVYQLYRDGHWLPLGSADNGSAVTLNQRGDVLWKNADGGSGIWLHGKSLEPLVTPPGVVDTPFGMSESRSVSGVYESGGLYSCFEMPWHGSFTAIEMPVPGAHCQPTQRISAKGWVTGLFEIDQGNTILAQRAFVWKGKGQALDIGTLSHAELASAVAFDINEQGQVVGYSETDTQKTRAFVWEAGTMRDIGESKKYPNVTAAYLINNRGEILGDGLDANFVQHTLRFDHGKVIDLEDEVENLGAMTSLVISSINDEGMMVGFAQLEGEQHAVILIPVHLATNALSEVPTR